MFKNFNDTPEKRKEYINKLKRAAELKHVDPDDPRTDPKINTLEFREVLEQLYNMLDSIQIPKYKQICGYHKLNDYGFNLYAEYKKSCSMSQSCDNIRDKNEASKRYLINYECARKRQLFIDTCVVSPDKSHIYQVEKHYERANRCLEKMKQ